MKKFVLFVFYNSRRIYTILFGLYIFLLIYLYFYVYKDDLPYLYLSIFLLLLGFYLGFNAMAVVIKYLNNNSSKNN
jgi:hypothetical protein